MIILIDNKTTNRFSLIKGEIKQVQFDIKDENGDAIDLSGAEFTFHVKETMGAAADLTVADAAMVKTNAATGTILVPIDTTGLSHSTNYFSELKIDITGDSVDHSGPIILTINQPVVE